MFPFLRQRVLFRTEWFSTVFPLILLIFHHIKKIFGDIVLCGIKIVGRNLSPTYFDNDILLIGKDRFPESGETGIFLIGNKVYIRKYIPGIRLELAPINGDKNSLFIDNIDDVHYFGRVLTVVRDA